MNRLFNPEYKKMILKGVECTGKELDEEEIKELREGAVRGNKQIIQTLLRKQLFAFYTSLDIDRYNTFEVEISRTHIIFTCSLNVYFIPYEIRN